MLGSDSLNAGPDRVDRVRIDRSDEGQGEVESLRSDPAQTVGARVVSPCGHRRGKGAAKIVVQGHGQPHVDLAVLDERAVLPRHVGARVLRQRGRHQLHQ